MPVVCYRGVTTKFLYQFLYGPTITLPAGVSDAFGNPLQDPNVGFYNGETVVWALNDGSVARSVIGGPPANDIYAFTVLPSPWESH